MQAENTKVRSETAKSTILNCFMKIELKFSQY